jgi:hypothetical protein
MKYREKTKKAALAAFLPLFRAVSFRSGRGGGGRCPLVAVTLAEFLDAASGVHNLLLARIKRVAVRADFNMQRTAKRRTRFERIAATASHFNLIVFRVNIGFHQSHPFQGHRHAIKAPINAH